MKSYLEIKVPLRPQAVWFSHLKAMFGDVRVNWQSGHYHITMVFLNDVTEEQVHMAKEIIGRRLQHVQPITMTFDQVDAFCAESGEFHVIHITSTSPNERFMRLTHAIREDLALAGMHKESEFLFHVTLGRVPADFMRIDEIQHRLSSLAVPAFSLSLHSLEYRLFRGKTLRAWTLQPDTRTK